MEACNSQLTAPIFVSAKWGPRVAPKKAQEFLITPARCRKQRPCLGGKEMYRFFGRPGDSRGDPESYGMNMAWIWGEWHGLFCCRLLQTLWLPLRKQYLDVGLSKNGGYSEMAILIGKSEINQWIQRHPVCQTSPCIGHIAAHF